MPVIFDTHAHYLSDRFDEDRHEVLANLQSKNVGNVVDCSVDYDSCVQSLKLAEKYDFLYTAVGIHPESVCNISPDEIEKIAQLIPHKKIVAIGEIGLDYYWDTPKDLQKFIFEEQLKLAKKCNLPVILHDRDAHQDFCEILAKYKPRAVLHCYSGSAEMAKQLVKDDYYFGFGGVITFKNAKKAVEAVEVIPLNRLLLETDCPYMAPVPFRGKRCDSSMICHIAEVMAEIKGVSYDEILEITNQNAKTLFNIK